MWQTWKLNPELADMQQFPHKFCRINSHSKQDDIHGALSKTINIRNVNQNKKLVWRSRFPLNEDPIVVYKPRNAGTVFQNTVFLTKIADCIGKHTSDKINDMSSMKVNLQIEFLQEQVLFEWGLGIWNNSSKHQFFMFGVCHLGSGDERKFETKYFKKYFYIKQL